MSIVVSGLLVIATFLSVMAVVFSAILDTSASQAETLSQVFESRAEQLKTAISIISASPIDTGGSTEVTVVAQNTGAVSVTKFSDMDVFIRYTTPPGVLAIKRLSYVVGSPSDGEWSLCDGSPVQCTITPDVYNPNHWDSDELATITMKVTALIKNNTSATVVVVVPGGISDSTTFTN